MTAFVVVSLFTALLVRLWSLQVVQGPQLNALARADTTALVTVPAPRGEIVTRDGLVLAGDSEHPEIVVAANEAEQYPAVITRLAHLLGIKAAAIRAELGSTDFQPVGGIPLVVDPQQVTQNDVVYIEQYPTLFPGVTVTDGYLRTYPQGSLATQLVGYIHALSGPQYAALSAKGYSINDMIGSAGLEQQYEAYLRGKPGVDTFEINPAGVAVGESKTTAPRAGDNVVLNIDGGLERFVQNALPSQLRNLQAHGKAAPWGAVLVMNVNTGAVLASASAPTYDDNDWVAQIEQNGDPGMPASDWAALNPPGCATGNPQVACPLLNYPVDGLQPPGSTFKLVTATAALDDGLINQGYYYDDTGSYTVGTKTFTDTAESTALGEVNVVSALTESSDVFFYNLGAMFYVQAHRYGPTPIENTAAAYGLGVNSGIDLPDVPTGQVDSPSLRVLEHREAPAAFPDALPYTEGDNVELAFGQGESIVSPLEIAEAYATFANGGTRYAPEIAAAIVNPTTNSVVTRIQPVVTGHVSLPQSTWGPMDEGFKGVVQQSSGTAYGAFTGFDFSKWEVAGKTGTADTCPNQDCQPTSWFVSFGGPAGEKPQYVVVVEINQGGYGATASAPVAREVWDYLESHPMGAVNLARSARVR